MFTVKDDSPQSLFSQEEGGDLELLQVIFTHILWARTVSHDRSELCARLENVIFSKLDTLYKLLLL